MWCVWAAAEERKRFDFIALDACTMSGQLTKYERVYAVYTIEMNGNIFIVID